MQAMEKATGATSAELNKMLELGQVGLEVLPKFGQALRDFAKQGGALGLVLETTRKQQARFLTQLQVSAESIFKGGFGEGFSKLLQELTFRLKKLEPVLKVIGNLFKIIFNVVRELAVFLGSFAEGVGLIAEMFGLANKQGGEFANTVLPKMVAAALLLKTAFGRILFPLLLAKATIEEIIGLTTKGIQSGIERRLGRDIGIFDDIQGAKDAASGASSFGTEFLTTGLAGISAKLGIEGAKLLTDGLDLGGIGDSITKAISDSFSSATMVFNINNNIDEFGNSTADAQISIQAANAQAQR